MPKKMLRYLGILSFLTFINICVINSSILPPRILCSPPRCRPECHIEKLPSAPCPSCVCPPGNETECPTCDERYFKHYETKQCKPVYENECKCPVKFDCPESIPEDPNACIYKGLKFAKGESVPTSNPCEICTCQRSYLGDGLGLSCISIECPSVFLPPNENKNCFDKYEEGKCCPTTECDDASGGNVTGTCDFEGKSYRFGAQMYSNNDPCLTCLCHQEFVTSGLESCKSYECSLERRLKDLNKGCVPIYHEKTCCPIEYHCPDGKEQVIHHPSPYNKPDGEYKCTFDGKEYNVGDEINIHHPTNCVTCTCATPPDIKCVHRSCPRPPNDDYQNCRSIYKSGECCATYICHETIEPQKICDPVKCGENCHEMSTPNGCPICQCNDMLCSPLKCDSDCEVDYDVAAGSCPTSKCPEDDHRLARTACAPVKCSPQCFEGTNTEGCPMCVCGPLCFPPKCQDGCVVQTNVPEGLCPGCECFNDTSPEHQIVCAAVKCPPSCHEIPGDHGCPVCSCDVLCLEPNCMPGCYLEHTSPCPTCVCDDKAPAQVQCSPVQCQDGCTEIIAPNGCSMCRCHDILCSPPKCEEGCTIDTEIPPSGCPGCKCPPSMPLDRPQCGPVKCGPQCYEGISPQGCPMCVCGHLCSPPKCEEGCTIQTDVPKGQCPGCVCESEDSHSPEHIIQCSPVFCPPYCRKTVGESGCETCVCDPVCSPPKCGAGCKVEIVPSSGPCPGCICDKTFDPKIHCAHIKCSDECQRTIDLSRSPCPFCKCHDEESEANRDSRVPTIHCSPPKCNPGCHAKLDLERGPCPACVCDNEEQINPMIQCSPPKCDSGCIAKLVPPGPCPSCVCDNEKRIEPIIQCFPPKCDPGCTIKLIPPGPCPSCVCDNEGTVVDIKPVIQCSPPKCDPGCVAKLIPPGPCPSCVCDNEERIKPTVMCSPPKCDPGCYPKLTPPGPCASCFCEKEPRFSSPLQCSPPKCDPGCYPKLTPTGPCPTCVCDNEERIKPIVMCSPPKCDPGCYPKLTPPGPCPSCFCDNEETIKPKVMCSPPKCDPGCYPKLTPPGPCPSCFCEKEARLPFMLQCSPPNCHSGCIVKLLPGERCPSCDCTDDARMDPTIPCSLPRCDPGCYPKVMAPGSCPSCVCESGETLTKARMACSPPRCDPGCYPKVNPFTECPSCFCREGGRVGGLECPQTICQLPCRRVALNPSSCPMCICDNFPICSVPKCEAHCKLEPGNEGCPVCSCPE